MTEWICAKCSQPVEADGWCVRCEDEFAAEVLEPEPHIVRGDYQFRRICHHFRQRGWMYVPDRMRILSELTGRPIHRYEDITQAEAPALIAKLAEGKWGRARPA